MKDNTNTPLFSFRFPSFWVWVTLLQKQQLSSFSRGRCLRPGWSAPQMRHVLRCIWRVICSSAVSGMPLLQSHTTPPCASAFVAGAPPPQTHTQLPHSHTRLRSWPHSGMMAANIPEGSIQSACDSSGDIGFISPLVFLSTVHHQRVSESINCIYLYINVRSDLQNYVEASWSEEVTTRWKQWSQHVTLLWPSVNY